MAYITDIEYKRRDGLVIIRDSDGAVTEHSADEFDKPSTQAQILAAYDAPPAPEPTAEEKLVALEKENAALRAVLIDKAVVTQAEIDAAKQ